MKIIKNVQLVLIAILAVACSNDDNGVSEEIQQPPVETQLKVRGKGVVSGETFNVIDPVTGLNLVSVCFTMDLFDIETNNVIGKLQDCDLETIELSDGSLLSNVLTTFSIEGKGSITATNLVLQKPLGDGVFSTEFDPAEDNIVSATGDFEIGRAHV